MNHLLAVLLLASCAAPARAAGAEKDVARAYQAAKKGDRDARATLESLAAKGRQSARMALAMLLDPPGDMRSDVPLKDRASTPAQRAAAEKHLLVAAKQGYAPAQTCYAMYRCKDPQESTNWLVKAGRQGYAPALLALSTRFKTKDPPLAGTFLKGAADANSTMGLMGLGAALMNGSHGFAKDPRGAVFYVRKSAEAGFPEAQGVLAGTLAAGEHVRKDMIEAYKWAVLARRVNPEAEEIMGLMRDEMRGDEIAEAEKRAKPLMARLYVPRHVCYDESLER